MFKVLIIFSIFIVASTNANLRCFSCTDCPQPFDPTQVKVVYCKEEEIEGSGEGSGEESGDATKVVVVPKSVDPFLLNDSAEDFEEPSMVIVNDLQLQEKSFEGSSEGSAEEPTTVAEPIFVCYKIALFNDEVQINRGCAVYRNFDNETCNALAGPTPNFSCNLCSLEGCNSALSLTANLFLILLSANLIYSAI